MGRLGASIALGLGAGLAIGLGVAIALDDPVIGVIVGLVMSVAFALLRRGGTLDKKE